MSSGAHRYAVCVASYGYMGDLMRASERLRFLGPARYGLAGAWTLLRGAAYDAEVCRPRGTCQVRLHANDCTGAWLRQAHLSNNDPLADRCRGLSSTAWLGVCSKFSACQHFQSKD